MKTYKFVVVIALIVASFAASFSLFRPQPADAAYAWIDNGYFTGQAVSGTASDLISGGLQVGSADGFISTLRDKLNNGDLRNQRGAALVVDELMGYGHSVAAAKSGFDDFETTVRAYAKGDNGYTIDWNASANPSTNSAYFSSGDDAFHEDQWDYSVPVIKFSWPGGSAMIERACGNMLGHLKLPKPADAWKLDLDVKPKNAVVYPGESQDFFYTVTNLGSDKATYDWEIRGKGTGGTYSDSNYTANNKGNPNNDALRSGSPNNVAVGAANASPDGNRAWSFTMPSGATKNNQYCQKIFITNGATGKNTGTQQSAEGCVHAPNWDLSGESQIGAQNATTITFNHRITNSGDNNARPITWTVKGQYNGGGWTASGLPSKSVVIQPGAGNKNPSYDDGQAKNTYTWPASAKAGDTYCQRIYYTDQNGPNTATGNSTSVCATFGSLGISSTVTPTTATPTNPTVCFDHQVKNLDANNASAAYHWWVTGSSPTKSDMSDKTTAKGASRPAYGGAAYNCYTFPSNTVSGTQKCESITATGPTVPTITSNACAKYQTTVVRPITGTVTIAPSVAASPTLEAGSTAGFTGNVYVSGVPTDQTKYGYSEVAVAGTPHRGTASLTIPGFWQDTRQQSSTDTTYYVGTSTPAGCGTAKKPCTGVSCNSGDTYLGWTVCSHTETTTWTEYQGGCRQPGATTYSWTKTPPFMFCNNYYTCPYGSNGSGWYLFTSPVCDEWECPYSVNGNPHWNQPTAPTCEKRCNAGSGERPMRYDYGDMNCYQTPVFYLTCTWSNGQSNTIAVTSNGSQVCTTTSQASATIGDYMCLTMTPIKPTSWYSVAPGHTPSGDSITWDFDVNPENAQGCTRFVGMPYFKVYGGDVSAAGGVSETGDGGECSTLANAGAKIGAFAKTTGEGAGTQFAAIARGTISQFVSGQFNTSLNPNPKVTGYAFPKTLSFANTSGAFGGNFAAAAPCVGFVSKLGNVTSDSRTTIGPMSIPNHVSGATRTALYFDHDIYIGGDITYQNTIWANVDDIPSLPIIVRGNIYIGVNVKRLDGLFAAIPKANGDGGIIYTCATGVGDEITRTMQGCGNQLVVNGSLVAQKINFERDCGTLAQSPSPTTNETTVTTGGTGNQNACNGANHAAEVINYTAEQWIRSISGTGNSDQYDAVTSMPPVL
jgi:hypothetical protein